MLITLEIQSAISGFPNLLTPTLTSLSMIVMVVTTMMRLVLLLTMYMLLGPLQLTPAKVRSVRALKLQQIGTVGVSWS